MAKSKTVQKRSWRVHWSNPVERMPAPKGSPGRFLPPDAKSSISPTRFRRVSRTRTGSNRNFRRSKRVHPFFKSQLGVKVLSIILEFFSISVDLKRWYKQISDSDRDRDRDFAPGGKNIDQDKPLELAFSQQDLINGLFNFVFGQFWTSPFFGFPYQ